MKTGLTNLARTDDSVTVWRSVIITSSPVIKVVSIQDAGAMCYLKSDRIMVLSKECDRLAAELAK